MTINSKIIVVMPAYNAEKTVEKTCKDIPVDIVSEIILCDDGSTDNTVKVARSLGLTIIEHEKNMGYGANQKSLYNLALDKGADIVVMVHPDYQYDPRVIPMAIGFLKNDICDIIIGSRIRTRKEALEGGMPIYKYISNRILTMIENIAFGQNLGDFHSGFRVYKKEVLENIMYQNNSNDFIFDTELLAQAVNKKFRIGDIPIPTRYESDSSSINFYRSLKYGILCIWVSIKYIFSSLALYRFKIFK